MKIQSVTVESAISVLEELEANDLPDYGQRRLILGPIGKSTSLPNLSLSPQLRVYKRLTSDLTIDLTNVNDPIYGTIDCTGRRVVAFSFYHANSNSATAIISPGSTNGYPIGTYNLKENQSLSSYVPSGMPNVSTTQKMISVIVPSGSEVSLVLIFAL